MSKYIDADRLKAEIERKIAQYSDWAEEEWDDDREYNHGAFGAFKNVRLIIDSLQQEQSETDLDADIEMEWDSFNKHLNEYGEESEDVVWLNWNSFADVARNFYELGLKSK